jgi:hypothetical protein
MGSNGYDKLIRLWGSTFYTDAFALACQLVAIITGLIVLKKKKMAYLFLLYSISAFLLFLSSYYKVAYLHLSKRHNTILLESSNIIFTLIEYIIFYLYFSKILTSKKIKLAMKIFLALLTACSVFFFLKESDIAFSSSSISIYSGMITSLELLFLAILCLAYYYGLFQKKPVENLLQSPSFWIVTGLFFYSLLVTPFFIISEYFYDNQKNIFHALFAAHFISFGILFLTITKAFLCRKPLTT